MSAYWGAVLVFIVVGAMTYGAAKWYQNVSWAWDRWQIIQRGDEIEAHHRAQYDAMVEREQKERQDEKE